jgi:hypothetical protein
VGDGGRRTIDMRRVRQRQRDMVDGLVAMHWITELRD